MRERWAINTQPQQTETLYLGVEGSNPYVFIDVGEHSCAVIVFGATQQEADERASIILRAVDQAIHFKGVR